MKLLAPAGVIALSALLVQAEDFTLKHFAFGSVITLHTTLTYEGKGARLVATAKNESGAPIQHAKICILSAAMQKGCLFELWNTKLWAPGAELTWNITTSIRMSNLAHEASLSEFDGGSAVEPPAKAAAASPLAPAPPPAPTQSRTPTATGSAAEIPSPLAADRPAPDTLTNDAVIKLAKAGLSDDVIVAMMNTQPGQYTATPTAVIALKQAGVSDRVIAALVSKSSGYAPLVPSAQTLQTAIDAANKNSASATPPAERSCTYFTVVMRDKLNNVKQGLSAEDVKWFQRSFAKKYPGVCYADPTPAVQIVFYITVTPDVYHGTRIVNQTSRQSNPISGTVTNENGSASQINGTEETTTTSSTAVPYSVEYGIFTLSLERRRSDGKVDVLHRFQQKGLYNTLYGIPLGGKGHHPLHAVIEDATKWIGGGGLADPRQSAF